MTSLIDPSKLIFNLDQLRVLMPHAVVLVGALLATLACTFRLTSPKWLVFLLCSATAIFAGWTIFEYGSSGDRLFNQMLVVDKYSNFFNLIFLGSALITMFTSFRYLDDEKLQHHEYYVLILFSVLGMMFMVSALELLVLFIAFELMSLNVYILVGFRRADRRSNEAAMKYFILGGAASAIMLYGVSLIYGITGTTQIEQILQYTRQMSGEGLPLMFVVGSWLMVVGFLFKVAAVPFHMWMPDVYEGAPTPITGFMTTGLKAAAFAAFIRVFDSLGLMAPLGQEAGAALQISTSLHHILWVCAVLTMAVGNFIALAQNNLKRMLAYSSIAHTGYLLVGLLAAAKMHQGYGAVIVYLLSYAVMNLGAFSLLSILGGRNDEGLMVQDMAGIARQRPWLGFAMAVFLFSMAGVPPTAGFIGKYLLFYSAIQAGEVSLVVISVLCSAVSVYYYLRVLVYMYMKDPISVEGNHRVSLWAASSVTAMVLLTLQFGVLPAKLVDTAKSIVENL